ncbi:LSU ribosomal protein L25P [Desulfitobacterium dichloroeliminans LMG P-21439]|uniref:Large ribosomal subunit protein bL25 n=1 Tax=Desulfitobacterium dichloroeliminans (strain LMG P-21439 / DCA1) TaxID=871963 RepID=L0F5L8_DESDL|nr:50S ribosomal protein L25 [Desulfitobacterium dichloroeliminans]AGA68472.1 LSU ribosomal protein L25P [Desulfitobacterium dichloroeliminans LMG P-21439]
MTETAIQAIERKEKPKKARDNGFVPGVLYGKGMDSISVKFDEKKLQRVLQGRSQKAKIIVKVGDETRHCFIQEIQRDLTLNKLIHISMQVVREDQIVKMKVPLTFEGTEKLNEKRLILQPYFSEIELTGPSMDIPEHILVDVANISLGEKITVADLTVKPSVEILDDSEKIIAAITASRVNLPASGEDSDSAN